MPLSHQEQSEKVKKGWLKRQRAEHPIFGPNSVRTPGPAAPHPTKRNQQKEQQRQGAVSVLANSADDVARMSQQLTNIWPKSGRSLPSSLTGGGKRVAKIASKLASSLAH